MTITTLALNDLTVRSINIFKTTEAAKEQDDIIKLIERLYTLPSFFELQATSYATMPSTIADLDADQLAEAKQIFVTLFSVAEVTNQIDTLLIDIVDKYIQQMNLAKNILIKLKELQG